MSKAPIAVIGAGLAGIACARALIAQGHAVRLFDKGRVPGGRLATRRAAGLQFDHGAQYLTAHGPGFAALLAAAGAVPWESPDRFVGTPGMAALPGALAHGLDLASSRHVGAITGRPGAWVLQHWDAALARPGQPLPDSPPEIAGPFAALAITLPPAQAAPLVAPHCSDWPAHLAAVRMAPCWTLMAGFPSRLPLPDSTRPDTGPLGWTARDSAKPGRDPATECWVVQASPDWSRAHLEAEPAQVVPALLAALAALAGTKLAPIHATAHRWRYALVEAPLGEPCLVDAALRIGLSGDWCLAGRAEAAFDSGTALAAALAEAL